MKRIYIVHSKHSNTTHLVRASSQSQAVSHVTRNQFTCKVATQDDLVKLVAEGKTVEDTGKED